MRKSLGEFRQKLKWFDPFTYVDLLLEKAWPVKNGKKTEVQDIGYSIIYVIAAFFFAFVLYQAIGLVFQTQSPIVIVVSQSMQPNLYRGDLVLMQGISPNSLKVQEIDYSGKLAGKIFSDFGTVSYADSNISNAGKAVKSITIGSKEIFPNTEGDVILYYSSFNGEQIIHRAILKIRATDGTFVLTKGDNQRTNWSFDQDCGKVFEKQIQGTDSTTFFVEKPCITLYPLQTSKIQGKQILKVPILGCVKVWLFDDLPSLITKGRMPDNYKGELC